ncbi:MAG: manganese efflux pump [Ruminococcaceae bacterium]|nr:manganese efflux pump [Oscillospiraceae bacterium]
MWNFKFFFQSSLLGAGLAMDAFSVSLVRGLCEPKMKKRRLCLIVGIFAFFQFFMPMVGWVCVHTLASQFAAFQKFIPYIALALLLFIGGNMLLEGIKAPKEEALCPLKPVSFGALILQGIATSIDALSVGFTIADYTLLSALVCCLIIAAVTFIICAAGVLLGRRFGTRLAGKAGILGGVILIGIGLEIFITGVFF